MLQGLHRGSRPPRCARRISTKATSSASRKNPDHHGVLANLSNVIFTPGGVTIMAGGKPIGGIGVGERPAAFRRRLRAPALDKIKDRMK